MQLGVFGVIAGALLVLNVFQRWLAEMIKLKLREGLTRDLVDLWMLPRPRVPARQRRADRRQSRPAHA